MTDGWISLHIFYAANANPVLVRCIGPLMKSLGDQGLISKWFFIRYWLEGPHLRLRMLPADPARADEVRAIAENKLTEFLRERPALYEDDRDSSAELYKNMYLAEYSEQQWNEEYGTDGEMPFRDNNSVHEIDYVREYDRYGGPVAMELAEAHFQRSSETVLDILANTNVHVRTVLLGQAAQLTMGLCFALLADDAAVAQFLLRYRTMWENSYQESSEDQHERFDLSYDRMRARLVERMRHIRGAARGDTAASPTPDERSWIEHCTRLRDKVVEYAAAGKLEFSRGPITDHGDALAIVLSSYVHMTNNRLGASILDEIYLSYVLGKALTDVRADTPAEVPVR